MRFTQFSKKYAIESSQHINRQTWLEMLQNAKIPCLQKADFVNIYKTYRYNQVRQEFIFNPIDWVSLPAFYQYSDTNFDFYGGDYMLGWNLGNILLEELSQKWLLWFELSEDEHILADISGEDLAILWANDFLADAQAAGLRAMLTNDFARYIFLDVPITQRYLYAANKPHVRSNMPFFQAQKPVDLQQWQHHLPAEVRAQNLNLSIKTEQAINFNSFPMCLRQLVCEYHEEGREDLAAAIYSFMSNFGDDLWGDLAFFYFYEDLTIIYRGCQSKDGWQKKIANHLLPHELRTIWG